MQQQRLTEVIRARAPEELKTAAMAAAKQEGVRLSDWLREAARMRIEVQAGKH